MLAGWQARRVDVLEAIATTRAIRRYTDDPIPDEDLEKMLFSATRAPTGSNRQNFRFLVLRDGPKAKEAKALLGVAFRAGWNEKTGELDTTGSPARQRMAKAMQHYVDHFEEVPVVVLGCLVRHRGPHYTEGASIYPACQNLLLAARALGYGGVLTMWHGFVEDELRALLAVPDNVALSACITLGKPRGRHGPVKRKPLGELVYDDEWGRSAPWV